MAHDSEICSPAQQDDAARAGARDIADFAHFATCPICKTSLLRLTNKMLAYLHKTFKLLRCTAVKLIKVKILPIYSGGNGHKIKLECHF